MSVAGAALAVLAAGALSAWVVWTYRRREIPVPGRAALTALRLAALLLVLLLLLDPRLPTARSDRDEGPWLLLDGSPSMGRAGVADRVAEAVAERSELPVLLFGDDRPRRPAGNPGNPGEPEPEDGPTPAAAGVPGSRLTPALERAAEAGAGRVVIVSDLRLEDAGSARIALDRLGLGVEVVDVDVPVRSAAVGSFRVPPAVAAAEAGGGPEEVAVEVTVSASEEAAGDSATVEVREEERLVASRRVVLPDPGRRVRLELALPAPAGTGAVRYEARVVLEGDEWERDDARVGWTEVDPVAGALVLLAAEPDWEPRFLLPVLGEVTGLRTRGLLRVGADRWLVMDAAGAAGTVSDARAAREAREAGVLVVQGGGEGGPAWLEETAGSVRRLLVLASSPEEAALGGAETGPPVGGEWYVSSELPPSPIAGELAGAPLNGLPPLGPVLPLRGPAEGTVPLRLRRGGSGAEEAGLVLLAGSGRRRAVTLAPGLWRWAFRPSEGREAYRRLWAGVGGWLLAEGGAAGLDLRPTDRVVAEGAPVGWSAGGVVGDTVSLALALGDSVTFDTTLVVPASGRFATPPLPAGLHEWTARTADGERSGRLDVEGWSAELLHSRAEGLEREAAPGGAATAGGSGGRPLRTHPVPYLLVLTLLCAEWILRRRRGLR